VTPSSTAASRAGTGSRHRAEAKGVTEGVLQRRERMPSVRRHVLLQTILGASGGGRGFGNGLVKPQMLIGSANNMFSTRSGGRNDRVGLRVVFGALVQFLCCNSSGENRAMREAPTLSVPTRRQREPQ
jgi:hypothetical protein